MQVLNLSPPGIRSPRSRPPAVDRRRRRGRAPNRPFLLPVGANSFGPPGGPLLPARPSMEAGGPGPLRDGPLQPERGPHRPKDGTRGRHRLAKR